MENWKVYMHILPNGLKYIGITKQQVEKRWGYGFRYQKNRRFFHAIVKYGWDNIEHKVLFDNLTQEQAEAKEKELIDQYRTNREQFGYNQTTGGAGSPNCKQTPEQIQARVSAVKGRKLTTEHKAKISAINKGRFIGEKNPFSKKVCQYDMQHNLIKIWGSQQDATRALGLSTGAISRVCRGDKQKTAGGYYWEFYKGGK
jgi:hypothetical protein